jgi:hypothetical protein
MHRAVVASLLLSARIAGGQDASPASGWVVLPVEEYRSLHDKAYPRTPEPEKPAADVVLSRVDYELHVSGEQAAGEARLVIDVFKDGWVRVPIPAGLRVRAARLDGKPVALADATAAKAAAPSLLLSKPGHKSVVLEIAVPLTTSAGTESLSLPAAGAAVTRAVVVVPRDGLDVKLSGALLAESTSAKGETRWVADGTSGSPISFSWQRRVEDRRSRQPLRLRGSVTQLVGLAEDAAQLTAEVKIEVVHGVATVVALPVPEGVTVNQVSGTNVGDWDVKQGVLTVTFLEPVESAETIVITGESRVPREGSLGIPLWRLRDAERETGGVAVEVLGAGEITDKQTRGLDPADPKDLGGAIAGRDSPLLVAFRFRAQETASARSLNVTVARYTPQAVLLAMAEEARYDALVVDDGKILVRGRYAVRNNQQSFLVVKLPEGASLWSAAVGGRPVRPGRSEEGALLVPLEKGRAGEEAPAFPVEIVYLERGMAWAGEGHVHLTLPALDLPVSRTGLVLYRSPHYRVTLEPGAFREQAYAGPLAAVLQVGAGERANLDDETKTAGLKKEKDTAGYAYAKAREVGRRGTIGILPLQVPFPGFGDVLFLASELTREHDAPGIDIRYKRAKGGRS